MIEGLREDQEFAKAARIVVRTRSKDLFAKQKHVLDLDDIERLHKMRVATRRLRAALEVFGPCFPRKRYRRALNDVKRLADALGERRDLDVQIESLAAEEGVEQVLEVLRADQRTANRHIKQQLKKRKRLQRRLRKLTKS